MRAYFWKLSCNGYWNKLFRIFLGGVIKDEVVKSPGNTIKIVGTHCQDSQQLAKSGGTAALTWHFVLEKR